MTHLTDRMPSAVTYHTVALSVRLHYRQILEGTESCTASHPGNIGSNLGTYLSYLESSWKKAEG